MSNAIKKTIIKKNPTKVLSLLVWETTVGDTLTGKCYACNREVKFDSFVCTRISSDKDNNIDNFKVTCKPCNRSCGSTNLDEYKAELVSAKILVPKLSTEDRIALIKQNSIHNQFYIYGRSIGERFDKMVEDIASNDIKWHNWSYLYEQLKGDKVLIDVNKEIMSIVGRAAYSILLNSS
jgi:hypothetical protein